MSETWGTITMIPVEKLRHHPENPRLDLGDLTELAASIKENGIMQNLTVVRPTFYAEGDDDIWWVVIGNRRMEASKLAGLEEVPCAVADMDQRTQIATMIQENMQRADLTVFEQAKGFQMMLDLGFSKERISEKTGFSRNTIDRRLAVATLPEDETRKAVSLGYDLMDLVEISKITDKRKQRDLLQNCNRGGMLDTAWLRQSIRKAQDEQEKKSITDRVLPEIEQFAKPLPEKEASRIYSDKWRHINDLDVKLEKGAAVKTPKEPDNYFYRITWNTIEIWLKVKTEKQGKSEAEIAREQKRSEAKELNARMKENRIAFVSGWRPTRTEETTLKMKLWEYVFDDVSVYTSGDFRSSYHSWNIGLFRRYCGMPAEEGRDKTETILGEIVRRGIPFGRAILAWILCGGVKADDRSGYASEYDGSHQKDRDLDEVYTILMDAGYRLTEEEEQWKNGTHPCFKTSSTAAAVPLPLSGEGQENDGEENEGE